METSTITIGRYRRYLVLVVQQSLEEVFSHLLVVVRRQVVNDACGSRAKVLVLASHRSNDFVTNEIDDAPV